MLFFPGRDQYYKSFFFFFFFFFFFCGGGGGGGLLSREHQKAQLCSCFLEKPGIEPAIPGLQGQ